MPRIARLAGKEREMAELTGMTLRGEIPFAESLRLRVEMLATIPVAEVRASVALVPLDPYITAFVEARREDCVVVTANLDVWISPLLERLGCRFFTSRGEESGGRVRLLSVLDKAEAAAALQREGRFLVAVGESVGDEPFFRQADYGIAFAGVHEPVPGLLRLAARVAKDGRQLCSMLASLERGTGLQRRMTGEDSAPCGG